MSDRLYSWTPDQLSLIFEYLKKQGVKEDCCAYPNWTALPFAISITILMRGQQASALSGTAGAGIPVVGVYCTHCSRLSYFFAWLITNLMEDA